MSNEELKHQLETKYKIYRILVNIVWFLIGFLAGTLYAIAEILKGVIR